MAMRRSSPLVVVLVTCPAGRARQLARALVQRRAAACVNVLPGATSWFRWQGTIERANESLLIIKTTARRAAALRRLIVSLHPYDVPEVLALPVADAHPPYQRWVVASVAPSP